MSSPGEQERDRSPADVSPATRSKVYVGSLILEALALLIVGLAAAFGFLDPVTALAVLGAVTTPLAVLNSGLGTKYRPTRPERLGA